jgi:hypothetical protein
VRKAIALIIGVLGGAAMLWGAWALFIFLLVSGEYLPGWLPPYVALLVSGGIGVAVSRRIWRGR